MKKFLVLFAMSLLCIVCGAEAMAAPKKVAVYVEGNLTNEQNSMVSGAVMQRLSGNSDYKVFERNAAFLRALEREHDYQLSGEVPESQIRTIGERYGVDYVIAICAVLTSDDQCQMSARLIDLQTGEVLKTCNVAREFENSSTITAMANNVAYRLLNKKSK